MKRTLMKRTDKVVQTCDVCTSLVATDATLCSRDCLVAARRELETNLTVLRTTDDDDLRVTLSSRNAELTTAMIGWRP
jgi:hypothetical protein